MGLGLLLISPPTDEMIVTLEDCTESRVYPSGVVWYINMRWEMITSMGLSVYGWLDQMTMIGITSRC